jgi:hypothetical protein
VLVFHKAHLFQRKHASLASMTAGMALCNDATRAIAQQQEVMLVDLERQVPKQTEFMYDDVHYTRQGSELAAKTIGDALVAAKLIPRVVERRSAANSSSSAGGPQP